MNITYIAHRVEIAFWTTFIAVLQTPRLGRILLQSLAGTAVLLFVMLAAAWVLPQPNDVDPGAASVPSAAMSVTPIVRRPANGQHNLLVLLVDRLEARRPKLLGIWLLVQTPTMAEVNFLPVYPLVDPQRAADAEQLLRAFDLDEEPVLPEAFIEMLNSRGLWWDHYWIVDRAGLSRLVELLGGVNLSEGLLSGQQVVARLPDGDDDPDMALQYQSQIAGAFCANSKKVLTGLAPTVIADLISTGSRSDLDAKQLHLGLRRIQRAGGVNCQFPTLAGR